MLDFAERTSAYEKSYITIGQLPEHVDPRRPPSKKAPFAAISRHALMHTTELVLPKDLYDVVWSSTRSKVETPRYIQVIMPLIALLEGEFFNTCVKSGSVFMLSEGRPGVDDVFSLNNGILTLQLGRSKYERSGLTGKPIRSGGRKHIKERFAVEIDLRQPSMLHGKKGFERIVWACRNVLHVSLTWLIACDAPNQASLDRAAAALQQYHPRILDCRFDEISHPVTQIPPMSVDEMTSLSSPIAREEYCNDISEWLALVALRSPRVAADDVIDPYLSRYAVPQSGLTHPRPSALVSLRWHGVMTSRWVNHLLAFFILEQRTHSKAAGPTANTWTALSASAFRRDAVENSDGYSILSVLEKERTVDGSFIFWEFTGASLST